MKKILIAAFVFFTSLTSVAQMVTQWQNEFGLPVYSGAYPSAMVLDDSSNAYILESVVNYNETACYDAVLHKVNKSGVTLWYRNFRTAPCFDAYTFSLKYHNGNLYSLFRRVDTLNGTPGNYICLAKVSTDNELKWIKPLGNWNTDPKLYFNIYNNYIYAIGPNGTFYGGKIYKISESGITLDSLVLRNVNPNYNIMNFVRLSNNNFAVMVYEFFQGERLYTQIVTDSIGYFITINGDFDLTCRDFQYLRGTDNSFYEYHYRNEQLIGNFVSINKYNNSGNLLCSKEVLAPVNLPNYYEYTMPSKLSLSLDNNLILCNTSAKSVFSNKNITVVRKLNYLNGDSLWTYRKLAESSIDGYFLNSAMDVNGNIYVASLGGSSSDSSIGNSYSIFKLSNTGNLLGEKFNDNLLQARYYPVSIQIAGNQDVVVNGGFRNSFYDQSLTIRYSQPVNITPNENTLPHNFSLSQNYPNPFNPSTTINFQIPKSNFVALKAFDINGRLVSELVNENLKAGEYKINFDGSSLSSGVYYYKLTSGDFIQTKKMILLK